MKRGRSLGSATSEQHVFMPLNESSFVEELVAACPEIQVIVNQHLSDNDHELLLHLLVADIRRFAIERFDAHDAATLERCLDAISMGLTDGDERVENAVAVSFVEDTCWWDPEMGSFIAAWPSPLRAEANRQREWRPPT